MKKYIIIVADTNDADYITGKKEITDIELEKIMPVIKCLQERKRLYESTKNWEYCHNWEIGEFSRDFTPEKLYVDTECLTKDDVDFFNKFIPYDEFGFHTIESIEIIIVSQELKFL